MAVARGGIRPDGAEMHVPRDALWTQKAAGRADVDDFRVHYRWPCSFLNLDPNVGYDARYCNRCQSAVHDYACNTLVPTQIVEPEILGLNFIDPGPSPAVPNSNAYRFGAGALCLCGINGPG